MRNPHVIREEITKLQSELKALETFERKRDSSVHVLENLGWKFESGRWVRPVARNFAAEAFDAKVHNPFRPGDWVENKVFGGYYRVHAVDGNKIQVQNFAHRVGPSMFTHKELYWCHADGFRSVPSQLVR